MANVLCFGELLLRMSPALGQAWIRKTTMPVYVGGAELNAAQALAKWKVPIKYLSAAPDHYLTHEILDSLSANGIDINSVILSGNRIGTYFLPQGADLKNAGVIYDRAHSSFSELQSNQVDWDNVLKGCSWFHLSAICPALNQNLADVCLEAVKAARRLGLAVSIDLNYRAKLWQYGKAPLDIMPELMKYCTVAMGNLWAAETMLGIKSPVKTSVGASSTELRQAANTSIAAMFDRYSSLTHAAYTFRLQEEYFGVLQSKQTVVQSRIHSLGEIVDKVGSGDCFMAGLIYGLFHHYAEQQIIDFAASAAVGKLYEVGDATNQSVEMIQQRIQKVDNK
ncbi:MAG: sugar kinase [Chitinophagaceae bacterium]|nr:sugar kinase [Chitinophagaceae bacterium]